ncbi:globin isoform X2 [Chrysoperla carnea]|nr:globin isoform X2 [Chrysoperla carnea]XP_044732887.1 globin isoform X2 [Chrysoperla carnea]XP_044732888.1 globin isoform X2 [Chrysoperla carnea]XP_044732889.1 globin isoform X2 [Chrysoperla carnea]
MGALMSYIWGPSLPPDYDVPDEKTGISQRDKDNVQQAWELILKKGVREMGISLFSSFFEAYPHNQKFFRTFKDTPISQLSQNSLFRAHSSNIMHAFTGIVGLLDDPEALVETLLKLGSNHRPRNIGKKPFEEFRAALPLWLSKELGSQFDKGKEESWDKILNLAWSIIYQTLLDEKKQDTKES